VEKTFIPTNWQLQVAKSVQPSLLYIQCTQFSRKVVPQPSGQDNAHLIELNERIFQARFSGWREIL